MTTTDDTPKAPADDLRDALDDGRFVILTSGSASLHGRPLTLLEVDGQGAMWFLVDNDEAWVTELATTPNVNVNADRQGDGRWVSVTGTATTGQDRARIDALWNVGAKAFWDSKDDPTIATLKVTPQTATVWQSKSSKLGRLFAIGKAALGGDSDDVGEQRTIRF